VCAGDLSASTSSVPSLGVGWLMEMASAGAVGAFAILSFLLVFDMAIAEDAAAPTFSSGRHGVW